MKERLVQVRLRSVNKDQGFSERTCFVNDPMISKGWGIKLANSEDPQRWWRVVWVGNPIDGASVHHGWDAGGIRSSWH